MGHSYAQNRQQPVAGTLTGPRYLGTGHLEKTTAYRLQRDRETSRTEPRARETITLGDILRPDTLDSKPPELFAM